MRGDVLLSDAVQGAVGGEVIAVRPQGAAGVERRVQLMGLAAVVDGQDESPLQ